MDLFINLKSLSKKDLNFYYRNLAEYTIGNKVIKNKSKSKIIKNYIVNLKKNFYQRILKIYHYCKLVPVMDIH